MTEERKDALRVAEETQDAYSYDAYTVSGWKQCCVELAERGYTVQAIEEILRSKWTRWAGDQDAKRTYGNHNSKTLLEFLDGSTITPDNWGDAMGLHNWRETHA